MPLINCKVELKLRWSKRCILSVAGTDNANGNNGDNNIIFTTKDTKLYVPVVTLSTKDNQKLSKLLIKGFEWSVYWNEYKTKSENKNTTNEYTYFLESNFVGINRFFVLVYTNEANNAKRFNAQKYYLSEGIIKNYNAIINRKSLYDQLIGSDINQYRLIAVDLSTEKELGADPRAIQQIEFAGQLKNWMPMIMGQMEEMIRLSLS